LPLIKFCCTTVIILYKDNNIIIGGTADELFFLPVTSLGKEHRVLIDGIHLGCIMAKLSPITCGKYTMRFEKTLLMGILNVTPDSFSDGGSFFDMDTAVDHGIQLASDGADFIDIGGESTRPGSTPLSEKEELERILPVLTRLIDEVSVPLSIDTYKPGVADACLQAGAHLINDITGLTNPDMRKVIARHDVPVVMMHMKGNPKTMQHDPVYRDVLWEIKAFFHTQIAISHQEGISQIIIDPGIGFGKTLEHNLQIIKHLRTFATLGCPVLIGPSRKSFIGVLSGLPATERLEGTLAAAVLASMNGAHIVRIHDVKECKRALQIVDAVRDA
jgi:dihydropteroate synthase